MKRISIFEAIDRMDAKSFKSMRSELKEHDSFFVLVSAPGDVSNAEREILTKILVKYGVDRGAFSDKKAIENAAWAIMSRSTLVK